MKYSLLLAVLLSSSTLIAADAKVQTTKVAEPSTTNNVTVVCPTGNCSASSKPVSAVTKHTSNPTPMVELEVPIPNPVMDAPQQMEQENVLSQNEKIVISVLGQGVAPVNTTSPAQAYALAKRAATADAYRLIAEKVKGVRIDGQDLIKNMMVQRSTVRTSVAAMVRNANLVETTFKEGLCEVEMEITLYHSQFAN